MCILLHIGEYYGDACPTQKGKINVRASQIQISYFVELKPLLSKLITNNQFLILLEINNCKNYITPLLLQLSKREKIPLSTLKSSAKALKELGLINFKNLSPVEITISGLLVLKILSISLVDFNKRSLLVTK